MGGEKIGITAAVELAQAEMDLENRPNQEAINEARNTEPVDHLADVLEKHGDDLITGHDGTQVTVRHAIEKCSPFRDLVAAMGVGALGLMAPELPKDEEEEPEDPNKQNVLNDTKDDEAEAPQDKPAKPAAEPLQAKKESPKSTPQSAPLFEKTNSKETAQNSLDPSNSSLSPETDPASPGKDIDIIVSDADTAQSSVTFPPKAEIKSTIPLRTESPVAKAEQIAPKLNTDENVERVLTLEPDTAVHEVIAKVDFYHADEPESDFIVELVRPMAENDSELEDFSTHDEIPEKLVQTFQIPNFKTPALPHESDSSVVSDVDVIAAPTETKLNYDAETIMDQDTSGALQEEGEDAVLESEASEQESTGFSQPEYSFTEIARTEAIEGNDDAPASQEADLDSSEELKHSLLEIVSELIAESPDLDAEIEPTVFTRELALIITKIQTLQKAKSAEDCFEALSGLRKELASLLLQLGYSNADALAEQLTKHYDPETLKKYMAALLHAIAQSHRAKLKSARKFSLSLYGTHAVKMVVGLVKPQRVLQS